MKVGDLVAYNGSPYVNAIGRVTATGPDPEGLRALPQSLYGDSIEVEILDATVSDAASDTVRTYYWHNPILVIKTNRLRLINSDSELAMLRLKGIG